MAHHPTIRKIGTARNLHSIYEYQSDAALEILQDFFHERDWMSFDDLHIFSSPDGSKIALRHQPAQNTPRGVVHINHGLAEHSKRYAQFAKNLNRAGYHVYAQDHRGHGQNIATDRPKAIFAMHDGAAKILSDVDIINQRISKHHPNLPIILFGHSMGGLIAFNYALQQSHKIHALSIWNANFGSKAERYFARLMLKIERMRKGSDVPSQILPKLTFRAWADLSAEKEKTAHTMFDWLASDISVVNAYIHDPLCGFDPSVSMWLDIFCWMEQGDKAKNWHAIRKNLPINFNGGALDPATKFGRAMTDFAARLQQAAFTDVTTKIYPHSRHETLLDRERDQATNDFIRWANQVVDKLQTSQ